MEVGLFILCVILFFGLVATICVVIAKSGENKSLRKHVDFLNNKIKVLTIELDNARRQLAASGQGQPSQVQAAQQPNPAAAPADAPAAAAAPRPAAPLPAAVPANAAAPSQAAKPAFAPAPSAGQPRPAVPQYSYQGRQVPPQYAQMQNRPAAAPQPPKEKTKISSINVSFGVGVMLMTIVGAVFISSSWGTMSDATRATVLIGAVAIVYLLSLLSGKVLGLRQTGFSFFTLGSLLMPVIITGIGAMGLWGPGFSFRDGNGFLVGAVAAVFLGAAGLLGSYIYKSGAYNGITYFGFTWTLLFTAAQMGSDAKERFLFAYIAIALTMLVTKLVLLTEFGKNIKYFKLYSDIMFYIGTCLTFLVQFFGEAYTLIGVAAACGAFYLKTREKGTFKYLFTAGCLALPVTLTSWSFALYGIGQYRVPTVGWEGAGFFLICAVLVIGLYAALDLMKFSDTVSDIVVPLFAFFLSLFYSCIFVTEELPARAVLLCGFVLPCLAFFRAALRPSANPAAKRVYLSLASALSFAAFFTGLHLMLPAVEDIGFLFMITALVSWAVSMVLIFIAGRKEIVPVIAVYSALSYLASWVGINENASGIFGFTYYCQAVMMTMCFIPLLIAIWIRYKEKKDLLISLILLGSGAVITFYHTLDAFIRSTMTSAWIYASILLAVNIIINIPAIRNKEKLAKYINIFYYILFGIGIFALAAFTLDGGTRWIALTVAALYSGLSYFTKKTIPAIASLFVFALSADMLVHETLASMGASSYDRRLYTYLFIIAGVLVYNLAGRFIHRKNMFKGPFIDAFTITSPVFMLYAPETDWRSVIILSIFAAIVLNLTGRVNCSRKIPVSAGIAILGTALATQHAVELPDTFGVEIRLAIVLATILIIRYLVKPGNGTAMRYIWFAGVAFSLFVEASSAALTGEITDLLIVGITSAGIFVYSFLRKAKLWFTLAVISIIGIAVYLSLTFWGSGVWTLYLLGAGILLISMAAYNEYCKRKASESSDGKKKRFFEEWTW